MWRQTLACSVVWALFMASATNASAKSSRRLKGTLTQASTSMDPANSAVDPELETAPRGRREPQILTKGEMLSLLKRFMAEIADSVLDAERQREIAIRNKDAIKLSCIQDRLSNMKSMKKLSDDRFEASQRPQIQADELNLRHEYRGVEMARGRVAELHQELLACVGENLEVTINGAQPNQVAGGAGAGESGPTNIETPPVDRPAAASVYQ